MPKKKNNEWAREELSTNKYYKDDYIVNFSAYKKK